jgi:hypothetical protein
MWNKDDTYKTISPSDKPIDIQRWLSFMEDKARREGYCCSPDRIAKNRCSWCPKKDTDCA